jgi:hypothetical protein
MKRIKRDSPAEEAAIQRGIANDADAAEWTPEAFMQVQHVTDVNRDDHGRHGTLPLRPWR